MLPDECYLLLHEVRMRGFVELSAVTEERLLAPLLDAGLVARARTSLRVTTEGRSLHATWARLAPGSEAEQVVTRAYERFLPLNAELLRVCHDWQVRPGDVPNDHRDLRYDWSVIDRLRALDERAAPVVRRAAREVARFEPYPRRLRAALARVEEGAHDWLTSPRLDSYHTVWMQLHEDLLLALGRDRASEAGGPGDPGGA
ncbi:MAG: hypothetical protein KatS3mg009_0083 [Acidimicrobiia bacterium]|nr:MAG: hypothetical protein KatS3mg009_0083 [Acidimicrobiia bacterium]